VRLLLLAAASVLAACSSAPSPGGGLRPDETKDAWYAGTLDQLTALNREAEELLKKGQSDQASALITKGQPLMNRLLAVRQPTLAAMEAAADLDDLYGRMLLANRHYGWARLQFQKNQARWTNWRPQTAETERRKKAAQEQIAECDRHLP
jgi:hypothetical protein